MTIKPYLSRFLFNIPGWRTNRKILVIESDDWGSIRMPSKEVYERCLKSGYPVDQKIYERYDSLASEEDLEMLFDLLASFKDVNGNHPVITANSLVANPDFEKIKADEFRKYHYELITETFKRYPLHHNNIKLWKQGMAMKVFHPQFHGREHLNVSLFMNALENGDRDAHFAFLNCMPGCIPLGPTPLSNKYVQATRYHSQEDKERKLGILLEGIDLFENLFGYKSKSIIPPNHTWSPDYGISMREKGVRFIQGLRKFREPSPGDRDVFHSVHTGMRNGTGQTFLVRNALFEPSLYRSTIKDPVSRCLSEMAIAFTLQKPVIIASHRINYVGYIDPSNRNRNLKMLHQILSAALVRWPDIEFKTSDQIGSIIENGRTDQ